MAKERKKIGLALGGGGAKGLAHIGVIKILEKYGIPIDFIAGTSMGALVGGWYAAHRNVQSLEKIFFEIDENEILSVRKVARKKDGILFSDKLVIKDLDDGFYGRRIEDLSIPFKAIATDVVSGEEVILDKGDLYEAINASIALPIVFKPVRIDGRILMDGGFANPVPADVVRKMGADYVIAVDVSSKWLNVEDEATKPQKISSLVSKAFSALEYQIAQRILKDADIIIRPAVLGYDWRDFYKAKEIIGKGADEIREHIEEIQDKTGYFRIREPKTIFEKIIDFYSK
jgi:NTE family protein